MCWTALVPPTLATRHKRCHAHSHCLLTAPHPCSPAAPCLCLPLPSWHASFFPAPLQAVDTIHRERIVHSDLKPANFLVVEGQLKLIDFGIAKAIQSGEEAAGRMLHVAAFTCCI